MKPAPPVIMILVMVGSLHSDALRRVRRLIHIQAPVGRDVITQQLHRDHRQQRAEQLSCRSLFTVAMPA